MTKVRFVGDGASDGAFGSPALWGGPDGYAVAMTSVSRLHFARFDGHGGPRKHAWSIRLRRGGIIDPRCTVIARAGRRLFTLTVGRRAGGRPTALLVGFDAKSGRYAGPARELDFPVDLAEGCRIALVPTARHLAVVAVARAPGNGRAKPLMLVEYKRDGHLSGPPVRLATLWQLAGIQAVDQGFVVVWEDALTGPKGKVSRAGRLSATWVRCP